MRKTTFTLLTILCFIVICINSLTYATPSDNSADDNSLTLTVAFVELTGYSEIDGDGTRKGLIVDYLNEIAKYTNWEYEYLDVTTDEIPTLLKEGKIDILGNMYYENAPSGVLSFPKYNIGHKKIVLLARASDDTIKSYDLSTLNNRLIGIHQQETNDIPYVENFLTQNNVEYTFKYYSQKDIPCSESCLPYLDSGHVDLLIKSNSIICNDHKVIAILDAQPYYLVTTPDKPHILEGLNMALEMIYSSNLTYANDCYYKNFENASYFDVYMTAQEKEYVVSNKNINIAIPTRIHPLCCINGNILSHNGITIDVLNEISDYSGFKFTYLFTDTYEESVELVRNGKAQILGFFAGSEKTASKLSLVLSAPYAKIDTLLRENAQFSLEYHSDFSIADISYGNDSISAADYSDICFAVARPTDVTLLSIINKAINNIDNTRLNEIISHNVYQTKTGNMTLRTLFYTQPLIFFSVVAIILALFLILVFTVNASKIRTQTMLADLNRANAASKAKSEFLSRMSHEIRTPMNAIIGLADLVTRTHNLPYDVQNNLVKIQSSSRFLLNLINDTLDMSRIESGKMDLKNEPFSMKKIVESLNNMTSPEAQRKNISYSQDISLEHDIFIGDALRIKQIIMNLLVNACKFTPEGGAVQLTIHENSYSADSALLFFSVKDTGIGIAPADHSRIFELFEQAGDSAETTLGSGLGLPICNSLVRIMNGNLELKSALGEGSEFYFSLILPFGEIHEDEPDNQDENILSGMHILLVEDNDLNAEVATKLLELQNASITRAENGKEAVDIFKVSAPGTFQAILMDIRMPIMNGLDATRAIRGLSHNDAATIPIIAMTANSFGEDCNAATKAGMTDYLSKPINIEQLYSVLLSCK